MTGCGGALCVLPVVGPAAVDAVPVASGGHGALVAVVMLHESCEDVYGLWRVPHQRRVYVEQLALVSLFCCAFLLPAAAGQLPL